MKTDKKKIIIFALLAIAVLVLAVWLMIAVNKKSGNKGENTGENLFPFGEILSGIGLGNNGNQNVTGEDVDDQVTENGTEEIGPQLRLINKEPTGGMIPIIRIEEIETSTISTDETGAETINTQTIEVENQFIRFSEIEDGSIYETRMTGEKFYQEDLIVENYLPNAEYAYFTPDGEKVSFQYWKDDTESIETYLGIISPMQIEVDPCAYDFSGTVTVGQENKTTFDVHRFLNANSATQVATSGMNSPGNEISLASELTINAIKRFQELHQLTADGSIGSKTRSEMTRVCNEQAKQRAQEEQGNEESFEIAGYFLPKNIVSLSMDPTSKGIFYLAETQTGVLGALRKFSDMSTETIFSSPFSEWTSVWNNLDHIELTTKPSYLAYGFSYDLSVSKKDYHKSFQQKLGLTTLPSPDNSKVLVFEVESGFPRLSIYNRSTHNFSPINIQTFTDKCVWSSDNLYLYCAVPSSFAFGQEYPDIWYQGLETYQDSLYRIDTNNYKEDLLVDLVSEYSQNIDIERIDVDDKNQYLYFIDKNTESLWSYRIEKE